MQMVVHGRERDVRSCHIEFDEVDGKYWYFVVVKYYSGFGCYDYECMCAIQDPEEALKRCNDIKVAIDAERPKDLCFADLLG